MEAPSVIKWHLKTICRLTIIVLKKKIPLFYCSCGDWMPNSNSMSSYIVCSFFSSYGILLAMINCYIILLTPFFYWLFFIYYIHKPMRYLIIIWNSFSVLHFSLLNITWLLQMINIRWTCYGIRLLLVIWNLWQAPILKVCQVSSSHKKGHGKNRQKKVALMHNCICQMLSYQMDFLRFILM